ncbi:MAG: hypothetical protein ACOZE5_15500 [Verrucomicrobiota bacterium]
MTAQEFESRIVEWVRRQPDVEALVQIGSRVQIDGHVDEWSDWDFHLISTDPRRYLDVGWLLQIAPCWSAHVETTERGVAKLSAVFAGGFEVDIVPLAAWQMKLVYWLMARPAWRRLYPAVLQRGIANTRLVAGPGYRVILGGEAWERRLAALKVQWPETVLAATDFEFCTGAFWRHAVWVCKKVARGESRAALRWNQVEAMEHLYALLAEEARLAGRPARPEARKAEQWLDARRLRQTDITTSLEQKVLARALLAEIELFEEVSRSVAQARGFALADHSAVAAWLRAELGKILGRP